MLVAGGGRFVPPCPLHCCCCFSLAAALFALFALAAAFTAAAAAAAASSSSSWLFLAAFARALRSRFFLDLVLAFLTWLSTNPSSERDTPVPPHMGQPGSAAPSHPGFDADGRLSPNPASHAAVFLPPPLPAVPTADACAALDASADGRQYQGEEVLLTLDLAGRDKKSQQSVETSNSTGGMNARGR